MNMKICDKKKRRKRKKANQIMVTNFSFNIIEKYKISLAVIHYTFINGKKYYGMDFCELQM